MRRSINLITIGLLSAAISLFATACPSGDGADSNAGSTGGDPAVTREPATNPDLAGGDENPCAAGSDSAAVADASEIFATNNCTMCHGKELEGSGLGPALSNLASKWNEEELKSYIRDASKYEDTGNRLSHDPKYVMVMPPFLGSEEDLDTLVEWLLTK